MKKKEETRSIRDCNLRENFVAALRRTSSNRVCLNGLTDQTGLILPTRKSSLDRCKSNAQILSTNRAIITRGPKIVRFNFRIASWRKRSGKQKYDFLKVTQKRNRRTREKSPWYHSHKVNSFLTFWKELAIKVQRWINIQDFYSLPFSLKADKNVSLQFTILYVSYTMRRRIREREIIRWEMKEEEEKEKEGTKERKMQSWRPHLSGYSACFITFIQPVTLSLLGRA